MIGWLADLAVGILHASGFAPWPEPAPAWLPSLVQIGALAWLAARALRALRVRAAFARGLAFGLGSFGAGVGWVYISMHDFAEMPAAIAAGATMLLAAGLGLAPAGAAALARALDGPPGPRRGPPGIASALGFACAWTVFELLRGHVLTGFPWLAASYAHVDAPLAGLAPLAGAYGVTLAAALVAALAAVAVPVAPAPARGDAARALRAVAIAVAVLATGAALRTVEWTQPAGQPLTVRLLQGNVPQDMKFDPDRALRAIDRYAEMAEAGRATLTVMPETAWVVPWLGAPPEARERLLAMAETRGAWIALGIPLPAADPWRVAALSLEDGVTNSVALIGPRSARASRFEGRYDKRHLVPFGEFIPTGFRWFVDLMRMPLGDFARGAVDPAPLAVADQRVAFNVCYEDLFGEELTGRVTGGATVLANVSNIAWFGGSHALPQHLQISRMRAIELGRPMIRATNTGVTAAIDHRGAVVARLPIRVEGALDATVQGTTGRTPFAAAGNAPVLAACAAGLAAAGLARRRRRRI